MLSIVLHYHISTLILVLVSFIAGFRLCASADFLLLLITMLMCLPFNSFSNSFTATPSRIDIPLCTFLRPFILS